MTDERAEQEREDDVTIMLERKQQTADDALRDIVRSIHDDLGLPDGYRAEIIGGNIVVAATPFRKHAYIVKRISRTVDATLLPEYEVFENITLEEPEIDRYIPDVAALPVAMMRDDAADTEWVIEASHCAFAAEVTSPGQEARDYAKANGYARGGVPVYLLVDRKARRCVIYTDPGPDGYGTELPVPFGNPVTLTFEGGGEAVIGTSDF
jgi:Uma2 family endonuclease